MKKSNNVLYYFVSLIIGIIIGVTTFISTNSPKSDELLKFNNGDFSIHFLELGNKYAGDSIYIKANGIDILIDAGSRQSSAKTIEEYVNQYCDDNTLEYVVATHAHQDHIDAFRSTSSIKGIFEYYTCQNIIDFGTASTYVRNGKDPSNCYNEYIYYRNIEIENGANYIAVSDFNEADFVKEFDLGSGVTMTILDNYYYYNVETSSNQNNYSVCLLFNIGSDNILLTGDLEGNGEAKLVENNDLPHCTIFKAAHHGSYTGSNDVLLDQITPEYVVFTCCAGSTEYTDISSNTFPSQDAIDRIAKHTSKCFVTTLCSNYSDGEFSSMNGNIVFIFGKTEKNINCSNNYTYLKDTTWFKENRSTPTNWR